MDFFSILSEDRIKKAYKDGEFDNLPGYGKPLPFDDLSSVPENLRMAYRIMKNAGFTDEENQMKKEMLTIEDLIKQCEDQEERKALQKKLNEKMIRFNSMMSKRRQNTNSSLFKNYEEKINNKLF
ncbi:DnaJ family domain-containing protein [Cytobacillus oceanisediminis]|uniref:DnaJ family domain-containing protein n=1 Tax=Cytobacillus oceanisediminis TaxID=665099 RepID=UPI002495A1FA|nr:DnaJ family domain-containing protein [Cytobacillus oceanisediminis]